MQRTGTKHAAHAAANLRADAGRSPIAFLDQDTFDELVILQPEQQFVRPVLRRLLPLNARTERDKLGGQRFAEAARQVAHLLERLRPAGHYPPANLAGAQKWLVPASQPGQ